MSTRSSSSRRVKKWHSTPPPPTPKIINLPRRNSTRRRKPRTTVNKKPVSETAGTGMFQTYNYKGKLESLFGVEREFTRAPLVLLSSGDRRERVESERGGDGDGGELAEEKWRFQAEILRAECNFLRMERKLALKKLEKNRLRIEKTLKSALQNLASGRKKLCEGKNMEEEMKELSEKLEELQTSYNGIEDIELRKCKNFDKKAARLQRRLEKLGGLRDDEFDDKKNINGDCLVSDCDNQNKSTDVEMLERKMEDLSKGMLDRMENEYGSIMNSSIAGSASTSKRIDFPDPFSFSNRYSNRTKEPSEGKCSGRCKVLVRRIVEQVRAETEQWSQMQEMLGQLRQEMEELQTSKNFWETQALASNNQIQILQSDVDEWREKAIEYETKANELQTEVVLVKTELEKLKKDQTKEVNLTPKKTMLSLGKQLERETKNGSSCRMNGQCDIIGSHRREKAEQSTKKDSHPMSLGKQLAREKRILMSRLKENRPSNNDVSRYPFKDIGNSSSSLSATSMARQNSNAVFPLYCPEPAK